MAWLFIAYAAIVLWIAFRGLKPASSDQFLMGRRSASPLFVGAALFTLIGGGELVTVSALAFSYGWAAIALLLGYALGFVLLAGLTDRIRSHADAGQFVSLPDYINAYYGRIAGWIVFIVSFLSFLALLVVQFIAAGELLSPLLGVSYEFCLVAAGVVTLGYLLIGGFETVLATDLLQAASRLLLVPLLVVAALFAGGDALRAAPSETLPVAVIVSLVVTGIFAAAASADVWQRVYAARDSRSAKAGLLGGALALVLFGGLLVAIGILARNTGVTADANQSFSAVMTTLLPPWAATMAILLVLTTVMSTADTEMFLLGGLVARELSREREPISVAGVRVAIVAASIVAMALALLLRDLVLVYTWLISALLIISPTVVGSLLFRGGRGAGQLSLILNTLLFGVMFAAGQITPETAYYVLLPGFIIYFISLTFTRHTAH